MNLTPSPQIDKLIVPQYLHPSSDWEKRIETIKKQQPELEAQRQADAKKAQEAKEAQEAQDLLAREAQAQAEQKAVEAESYAVKPAQAASYGNSYDWGQCTWYVASRRSVPGNWGNAYSWLYAAQAAGWATGSTPRVGAIAQTTAGPGHVAYVEAVNGNQVYVSEMHVVGLGVLSYGWYPATYFSYIY